jgi:hypothetical protein
VERKAITGGSGHGGINNLQDPTPFVRVTIGRQVLSAFDRVKYTGV